MDATITVVCDYCAVGALYRPSAIRVVVYSHGVIVMEFFCLKCHAENRRVIGTDLAEHLDLVGVRATLVHTPGELLEHPPEGSPAVTEADVERIEGMTMDVFNRLVRFEADKRVGDVEP